MPYAKDSLGKPRYRVCPMHLTAESVQLQPGGPLQRYCRTCSRWHNLIEFSGARRTCVRQLAAQAARYRERLAGSKRCAAAAAGGSGTSGSGPSIDYCGSMIVPAQAISPCVAADHVAFTPHPRVKSAVAVATAAGSNTETLMASSDGDPLMWLLEHETNVNLRQSDAVSPLASGGMLLNSPASGASFCAAAIAKMDAFGWLAANPHTPLLAWQPPAPVAPVMASGGPPAYVPLPHNCVAMLTFHSAEFGHAASQRQVGRRLW